MDKGSCILDTFYFSVYKWLTFGSMYTGYAWIMFCRKSFSFAIPAVLAEGKLTNLDIGMINSGQSLAYTISKLAGGVMSDSMDNTRLFGMSMLLTGILTIAFTTFNTPLMLTEMWFLQGLVQGGSWPACSKILQNWTVETEFGTLWSILSTSMNLAASVGPIIITILNYWIHWKTSLQLSGALCVLFSFLCFSALSNSPEDVNLPVISGGKKPTKIGRGSQPKAKWTDIISSNLMCILASSYLVISLVRASLMDWGQTYLIQDCKQSDLAASMFLTSFELGGLVGSIAAGVLSDYLVRRKQSQKIPTSGSPRMVVTSVFLVLTILGLHRISRSFSPYTGRIDVYLTGAVLGAGIYGPISLYGVMAIESAPKHLAGTSHSIVAFAANIGMVLAGYPVSWLAEHLTWKGVFTILEIVIVISFGLSVYARNSQYKMVLVKKKKE